MDALTDVPLLVAELARDQMPVLVAVALRVTRDVGIAEECAQEALLRALQTWPESGVPENPAAWLTTTARHRALDLLRHRRLAEQKLAENFRPGPPGPAAFEPESGPALRDDLLRLVVACCHESISREQQAALALRLVCGLTTTEIARLFLVPEPTMAQRLVRARRTLEEARAGWQDPTPEHLAQRLPSVLDVAYLLLTEAHGPSEGDEAVSAELLRQALRLALLLADLVPDDSEVLGLAALACLQAARCASRRGGVVLLADQDRSLWDEGLIGRGLELLRRASLLGDPGRRQVEAALAACHAVAPSWPETDWPRIVRLYDRLLELAPSPIAELNRAAALSFAVGPAEALAWLDSRDLARLSGHHLLPATRADLLRRLERRTEAASAYESALRLCTNEAERAFLRERLEECRGASRA